MTEKRGFFPKKITQSEGPGIAFQCSSVTTKDLSVFVPLTWIQHVLQQNVCCIFAPNAATFQKRKASLHNWCEDENYEVTQKRGSLQKIAQANIMVTCERLWAHSWTCRNWSGPVTHFVPPEKTGLQVRVVFCIKAHTTPVLRLFVLDTKR